MTVLEAEVRALKSENDRLRAVEAEADRLQATLACQGALITEREGRHAFRIPPTPPPSPPMHYGMMPSVPPPEAPDDPADPDHLNLAMLMQMNLAMALSQGSPYSPLLAAQAMALTMPMIKHILPNWPLAVHHPPPIGLGGPAAAASAGGDAFDDPCAAA